MQKKALAVLFFTAFLDMIGLGVLIPVIPVMFADPASPHYLLTGTDPASGYLLVGVMLALFSLGQFVASPIIGQFSDKYGRKRLLMISIAGTVLGHGLFALGILTKSVGLLLFTRLLTGITTGNIVIAQAAIADLSKPEERAKNFGLIGAAFGLGFILGPFLGGKLADASLVSWFNASTPFWFAAALSFLNLLFVGMMLPETNTHQREAHKVDWTRAPKNIIHAFNMQHLRPLFITNFLLMGGFAFYMTFSSVFLLWRFGFTESSIGNYFAYVGLWITFTQGVVTRFLSGRVTEANILKHSLFGIGMCILAITLVPAASWLYFVVPIFAISMGLSTANLAGLLSRSAGNTNQGEILGINGSVSALATMIPPFVAGPIAVAWDPSGVLVIAAIIILLSGVYFVSHLRTTNIVSVL
jgi:MFS transporter, DHA1 family, tetracycline resistance protein